MCDTRKIFRCGGEPRRLPIEITDSQITPLTQKAPDEPGCVTMVHHEFSNLRSPPASVIIGAVTNGASATLFFKYLVVIFKRNSVLVFQPPRPMSVRVLPSGLRFILILVISQALPVAAHILSGVSILLSFVFSEVLERLSTARNFVRVIICPCVLKLMLSRESFLSNSVGSRSHA